MDYYYDGYVWISSDFRVMFFGEGQILTFYKGRWRTNEQIKKDKELYIKVFPKSRTIKNCKKI